MKIIDKSPWQDDAGEISAIARIQGTFRYGFNWSSDQEAQKAFIAQLNKPLEKGFVLIRNFKLPNSEIIIPIILIGPGGIQVIDVTNAKGEFEAKGDQWNTITRGISQPAPVNYIARVLKFCKVLAKYLEIHKISIPTPIDPVLIVSDPGAQVESMRPAARVVRSDAIPQFTNSLLQAKQVFPPGVAFELADGIIDPSLYKPRTSDSKPVSRAQAIFNASEPAKDFNPNDLGFEFDGESEAKEQRRSHRTAAPKKPKILGMTYPQFSIFIVMFFIACVLLAVFAYILYTLP